NVLNPSPGFNNQENIGSQVNEKKPSLEDLLSTFIMETRSQFNKDEARMDNIETHMGNMGATMKSFEVQIGQLASSINAQKTGKFLSDTEVNPKEHYKAITLISGREVGGPKPQALTSSQIEEHS
ncbi:hypothetical protein PanWU01x14_345350, partial [Parasponia andersonii]